MNIFSELIPLGLAQYLLSPWEEGEMICSLTILLCQYDSHFILIQLTLLSTFYTPSMIEHEKAQKHFLILPTVKNENLF